LGEKPNRAVLDQSIISATARRSSVCESMPVWCRCDEVLEIDRSNAFSWRAGSVGPVGRIADTFISYMAEKPPLLE